MLSIIMVSRNNQFITFPLRKNSKVPAIAFTGLTEYSPRFKKDQNIAVLCGKVSDVFVVDLDFYKIDKSVNKFIKIFGDDFIEVFDTYTVKTANGGYHLYFKYDSDFKNNTTNDKYKIDIRSNGGYVVAPSSVIDGKDYIVVNDSEVKSLSYDLRDFLHKIGANTKKRAIVSDSKEYVYTLSDDETLYLLEQLPSKYLNDYSLWLKVSTVLKKMNRLSLWDKWSKSGSKYDSTNNLKIWDTLDTSQSSIFWLFNQLKNEKPRGFYAPVCELNVPDDEKITIHKQYLGDIIHENVNYVIKSDTGTGKTTSFHQFISKNKKPFISLVSRQMLGKEQAEDLRKLGVKCKFYLEDRFEFGDNIIICLDSLHKLQMFDFSDYVFFIDEFNSVVEYLISSNTALKKYRRELFNLVKSAIEECSQFIAVDADISPLSYYYAKKIREFQYIENTFKKFQDVPFIIYQKSGEWLEELKKKKKFLLFSDSASKLHQLHEDKDINFKLVTRKSEDMDLTECQDENKEDFEYFHLDHFDCLGCSPKITYGMNSHKEREVFCYYTGKTITPPQMVQQIARCRNQIKVHIFFESTTTTNQPINNLRQNLEDLKLSIKTYSEVFTNTNEEVEREENSFGDFYIRLLCLLVDKLDKYDSNKYEHFLFIMQQRGFIQTQHSNDQGSKIDFKHLKNLEVESTEKQFLEDLECGKNYINRINSILRIPTNNLVNYSQYFVNPHKLANYFNYCQLFHNEKVEHKIKHSEDYITNKLKSTSHGVLILRQLAETIQLDLEKPQAYNDKSDIKPQVSQLLKDQVYSYTKRTTIKNPLDTYDNVYQCISKIYKSLFGDMVNKKQKRINNKRVYIIDFVGFNEMKTLYTITHTEEMADFED